MSNGAFNYEKFLANSIDDQDIFEYVKFEDLEATRKTAMAVAIGAGVPIGKSKLHLKIDWHGGIDEYDRMVIPVIDEGSGEIKQFVFKEELNAVFNFGAGAEIYIGSNYNAYVSFSTDFSPTETNANIFDLISDDRKDVNLTMDYYHFGMGIDMKLSWAKMVLGTTYSKGSTQFDEAIDLPQPIINLSESSDMSTLVITRWRFIIGLEIPIFGQNIEVK